METEFTPLLSLAGGLMIGLATTIYLLTTGRVAGVSGVLSGLLPPIANREGATTSLAFVAGLILAVPLYIIVAGRVPEQTISGNLPLLAGAGLLVGIGTVMGNGCTSGHGVCGVSRLSHRSIAATGTFVLTAFATVLIWRHLLGGS